MNKPYIFYPVILLLLIITMYEIFMVFDGFERVRVRLRGSRKVQNSRLRRQEVLDILDDKGVL